MHDIDRRTRRRAITWAVTRIVVLAVGLLGLYFWLPFDRASVTATWLTVVIALVVLVGVDWYQLRAVAVADLPSLRAVEALTVSVLLLLVMFAATYISMSGRDAAAFSEPLDHVDGLYFTLTTLTTIGFGDIAPVSSTARVAVMTQMVVNVIVLGVFVKLVTSTVRSRLGHTSGSWRRDSAPIDDGAQTN